MVLDVALDNGDSRFIKHLLALSMRRARQQGTRGGQEMENNARCLGKAYGSSPTPHGALQAPTTGAAVPPGLAPDPPL